MASVGTVRRLLNSCAILIVIINPPNIASSVDSHIAALFLPFASRTCILATYGALALHFVETTGLDAVLSYKFLYIGHIKPYCSSHLHERNPTLPYPTVKSRDRHSEMPSRGSYVDKTLFSFAREWGCSVELDSPMRRRLLRESLSLHCGPMPTFYCGRVAVVRC
jgi:hypothetical protein